MNKASSNIPNVYNRANQIEDQNSDLFEKCMVKEKSENMSNLCDICNNPIQTERLQSYPEVTTCISCQTLLEDRERLRTEIAQLHHSLTAMKNQYDIVERHELASNERLEVWRKEIQQCHERLIKLQAAFFCWNCNRS